MTKLSILLCGILPFIVWSAPEVELDAQKLDPNMMIKPVAENGLKWYTPAEAPMKLNGFYWYNQDRVYRRLPLQNEEKFPDGVEKLSWHTAGGQVLFRTDSARIVLKVKLKSPHTMYHMASSGSHGFDLYTKLDNNQVWRYSGTSRVTLPEYTASMMKIQPKMRSIMLNFPLYGGVESVFIGLDDKAKVEAPFPYRDDRPVIVYGTSITQGGCASRPGMAWTNILSRKLNVPFINLGFSGNGKGEPVMARLIGAIKNPSLIVLDYEANAGVTYPETLPEFIRIIREMQPATPILVISKIRYVWDGIDQDGNQPSRALAQSAKMQQELVDTLRQQGDRNIFFIDNGDATGIDFDETSVDGVHPTDLGFQRIAAFLEPEFKKILKLK